MAAAADNRTEPVGSRRVQRKRGRRMRQIVRTAADLFGEHGYEAVNLEDVADALDVTKGSLYYYFSSKSELGTAAIETLGNEWIGRLAELTDACEGGPAVRLRALIAEHMRIAVCEYPAVHRLFLVPQDWPDEQSQRVKDLRRRHDALFRAIVGEGVESGDFAVASTDATLQCMHAAMTQTPRWCARLDDEARMRAIDEVTETLMRMFSVGRAAGR